MAGNGMPVMTMMPEPSVANVPMVTGEPADGAGIPLVNPVAVHSIL